MHTSGELQTAIDAAKTGGKVALKYFKTSLNIRLKDDNSFVTDADIATEEAIKKYIIHEFPKAKFVAEEGGGSLKEKDCWIIDPIDGTRVFAHDIEQWSILIAHYVNGKISVGVSYSPTQNILLVAEKGKGVSLNEKSVSVSKTKSARDAFGSFGSLHRFENIEPILKLTKANVIFRSYEHAYALSLLASGKMDVVIDGYGKPWDYAPFISIIEEAGGKVTDFEGEPWNLETKTFLATNGVLHDEILKILNS